MTEHEKQQENTFGLTGVDIPQKASQEIGGSNILPQKQQIPSKLSKLQINTTKIALNKQRQSNSQSVLKQVSKNVVIGDSNSQVSNTTQQQQQPSVGASNQQPVVQVAASQQMKRAQSVQQVPGTKMDKNKFETISSVIHEFKSEKKAKQKQGGLLSIYNSKIQQTFERLYATGDNAKVVSELKQLEKKKILQQDLQYRQMIVEESVKRSNMLKYEIERKMEHLKHIEEQIQQVGLQQIVSNNAAELVTAKETFNTLFQEVDEQQFVILQYKQMLTHRRNQVLFMKKQCAEEFSSMEQSENKKLIYEKACIYQSGVQRTQQEQFPSLFQKHLQKSRLYGHKYQQDLEKFLPSRDKFGAQFNALLEDELDLFEETRAVQQIFFHENQLEDETQQRTQEMKRQQVLRAKREKDRQFERIRKERKQEEDILKAYQGDFDLLRAQTAVSELSQLRNFRTVYIDIAEQMKDIDSQLRQQIQEEQEQICKTKEAILQKKQEALSQQQTLLDDIQIDKQELDLLHSQNKNIEDEQIAKQQEKTIDGVSTIVSRILYQLKGGGKLSKQRNVEVNKDDLLNSLSVAGLKLERMLTMLYKKKSNFRMESVNTDDKYTSIPDFIGLNPKNIFQNQNQILDREFKENEVFLYNEEDSKDLSEQNYIQKEREAVKTDFQNKIDEKNRRLAEELKNK